MKKLLLIFVALFLVMNLFGQVRNFEEIPKDILKHFDKMGINDSLVLNKYESAYFNVRFKDSLNGFDFTNKKIVFFRTGIKKSNKKDYFDMQKKHSANENYPCDNGTLYIFDPASKKKSGGYDAAIVYWNKVFVPIEKIVERLKEQP